MIAKKLKDISPPVYSSWLGKQVVLLVMIRQCHVPMRCSIIGESLTDVRVRVHPGWEMDIRKELILAVEEDAVAVNPHKLRQPSKVSIVSIPFQTAEATSGDSDSETTAN